MADYLLDANHISPLVTPNHPLRHKVLQRLSAGDTFSIPVVALAEMLFGVGLLPRARESLATLPLLVAYILGQKQFITGLTTGAVR